MNSNKERIKEIIYTRGLWTDAKKYSDSLKNKEIEWVLAFNAWLENELKGYDYPVIEYNGESDILKLMKYL